MIAACGRLVAALALFAACGAAMGALSVTDDSGRRVELQVPARSIVTLAPFLTELVFAAGAGDRVVAASAHSDYPEAARKLPQVASAAGVSIERLARLQPDLVLAWRDGIRPEEAETLRTLGIAVYVAQARRLADVPRLLQAIGRLTGRDVAALVEDFDGRLESLRKSYGTKRKVAVFLEIWNRPLTTISGDHFINDALAACGADNVFKDLAGVAPQVSWEAVYRRNPAVVVGVSSAANEAEFQSNWLRHATLEAVKAGRLVFLDADALSRPTPRTPDAIARLCVALDAMRVRLLVPRS